MAGSLESVVPDSAVSTPGEQRFSRGYRAWMLFVLFLVSALNLADRTGIAAIAPAIKAELALSDTELGLLQGLAFAIFYTIMGLPLARLAEHRSRSLLLSISVAVFGVAAACCGFSTTFAMLVLCRIAVAIGDGGFSPIVGSLIGDHYPMNKRASAMSVIWFGAPVGAAFGSIVGGWLAQNDSWRHWFFVLSVPALVIAVLCMLTLREPSRGMSDSGQEKGAPPAMKTALAFLLRKRSMRHVLIGAGLAAMTTQALGQFWGRFLVSVYHTSFAEAGRLIGFIVTVSMLSGFTLGGFGLDWVGRRDRRWYVWGPAIGLLVSTPLMLWGVTRPGIAAGMPFVLAAHVALFVYYTPTLAIAQNMVAANMRASSAFVAAIVLGLVGTGLGPSLTGILSDFFAQQAFGSGDFKAACVAVAGRHALSAPGVQLCQSASATGIRYAIMTMSLLCPWGAIHYFLAARHFRADLETRYSAVER